MKNCIFLIMAMSPYILTNNNEEKDQFFIIYPNSDLHEAKHKKNRNGVIKRNRDE